MSHVPAAASGRAHSGHTVNLPGGAQQRIPPAAGIWTRRQACHGLWSRNEPCWLAWLCTQLPALRVAADRDGWRGRLDPGDHAVRAGGSALRACRRLGVPMDQDQQKSPELASLAALGLDPGHRRGRLPVPVWPLQPPGSSPPAQRPPVCAIDGTPGRTPSVCGKGGRYRTLPLVLDDLRRAEGQNGVSKHSRKFDITGRP